MQRRAESVYASRPAGKPASGAPNAAGAHCGRNDSHEDQRPETTAAQGSHDEVRPNFDSSLHRKLVKLAADESHGAPTPEDIFDYIYAVLHCPAYRKTYAEFLRIDFPRIPWPKDAAAFWISSPTAPRCAAST